jgi:hypothetical protein
MSKELQDILQEDFIMLISWRAIHADTQFDRGEKMACGCIRTKMLVRDRLRWIVLTELND